MEQRTSEECADESVDVDGEDHLLGASESESESDAVRHEIRLQGEAGLHKAAATENWATLWVILVTTATLVGRRLLTTGFRMFSAL